MAALAALPGALRTPSAVESDADVERMTDHPLAICSPLASSLSSPLSPSSVRTILSVDQMSSGNVVWASGEGGWSAAKGPKQTDSEAQLIRWPGSEASTAPLQRRVNAMEKKERDC